MKTSEFPDPTRPLVRPYVYKMEVYDVTGLNEVGFTLAVYSIGPNWGLIGTISFIPEPCFEDPSTSRKQWAIDWDYGTCFGAALKDDSLRKAWDETVGQRRNDPADASTHAEQVALNQLWNDRWDAFDGHIMRIVMERAVDLKIDLTKPMSRSLLALFEIAAQRVLFEPPITSAGHGLLIPFYGELLWHGRLSNAAEKQDVENDQTLERPVSKG
jgi:hypothetical protein